MEKWMSLGVKISPWSSTDHSTDVKPKPEWSVTHLPDPLAAYSYEILPGPNPQTLSPPPLGSHT